MIDPRFEPSERSDAFGCRWGAGNPDHSTTLGSNKKLCFTATDQQLLIDLLYDLSNRPDAIFVKYSLRPKDGMYLGRCFLMDEATIGELWQTYKAHPKLMCSVQDDDWTTRYRRK